ncbi:Ycf51 family protein [Synechococcus sp. MIT S1220]|uniref:Ycf51 family protein n=1 Tax=Synechococcus sp. MIT S1220 TaxID=3082549 RepID=UPI0039B103EE
MPFDQLLLATVPWLLWAGVGFSVLTVLSFVASWGFRFRLVGVSSFTFLLAISCWAFSVSYSPPVEVEGAVRAPIVFDNGDDLVVAQAPSDLDAAAVGPTLSQLSGNLRGSGRSSSTVTLRLRAVRSDGSGTSTPVILGETERNFLDAPIR